MKTIILILLMMSTAVSASETPSGKKQLKKEIKKLEDRKKHLLNLIKELKLQLLRFPSDEKNQKIKENAERLREQQIRKKNTDEEDE